MKFLSLIYGAVSDLIIRYLPNFNKDKYFFAFLVHPRNTADIYRKYPFFRYFPDKFTDWAFRHFWPVVLSEVEGVKSIKNGKNNNLVAIVGATGSIGSSCLKILARAGYDNFLLVDIERKAHFFENLVAELKKTNPEVKIQTSNQIRSIKEADFIITATNAPEAVVTSEDLKSGSVVVDDAQPSDVSPEVFDREDVIAVEGGLLHTPNIKNHFNFGLKDKYDNFSCMGEIMVLAAHEHRHNYVINKPTLENIDEISAMAGKMGIRLSEFQNAKEKISREKLARVCNIIKNNIK